MKTCSCLRLLLLVIVLAISAAGCTPLELLQYQASPTGFASTPDPITQPAPVQMVSVNLWVKGQAAYRPELVENSTVQLTAAFAPVLVRQTFAADGSLRSSSTQAWPDAPIHEMRVCFSAGEPCTPSGAWQPFQTDLTFEQPVDWVGPNTLFLSAEFRDSAGEIIPAGMVDQLPPANLAQVGLETVARMNPDQGQPASPQAQTAQAATQAAFPVSGGVLIEDGICCAGGTAGSQVELSVAFSASSPTGAVDEMRVQTGSGCLRDAAALDAPWEPFTATRSFTTTLAANWVGFYVNVQYRDTQGNLSPVYCDDISLEGNP